MKKGKIILGAAAALVTIGSSLAFKAKTFVSGTAKVHVLATGNACLTCLTTFFVVGVSAHHANCRTKVGSTPIHARNSFTFFTQKNASGQCINPTTKTTLTS